MEMDLKQPNSNLIGGSIGITRDDLEAFKKSQNDEMNKKFRDYKNQVDALNYRNKPEFSSVNGNDALTKLMKFDKFNMEAVVFDKNKHITVMVKLMTTATAATSNAHIEGLTRLLNESVSGVGPKKSGKELIEALQSYVN